MMEEDYKITYLIEQKVTLSATHLNIAEFKAKEWLTKNHGEDGFVLTTIEKVKEE